MRLPDYILFPVNVKWVMLIPNNISLTGNRRSCNTLTYDEFDSVEKE